MKNNIYINVEFIVYEFVSMEHWTKIVIIQQFERCDICMWKSYDWIVFVEFLDQSVYIEIDDDYKFEFMNLSTPMNSYGLYLAICQGLWM